MKLKPLIVVVALLSILSGIAYFAGRPESAPSADPRVGQPFLAADAAAAAAKIHFTDQGKTVSLARAPDGPWLVDNYFGLPADMDKLARFVTDLTEAKVQRLVTENPERLERLEFKDTKIELLNSAGKEIWSVVLGKNADSGGRFVRFDAEPKAFLANVNAWLDTEPKNWADAQLLSLKADDIAKVEIPLDAGARLVVTRAKKGDPWSSGQAPAGQRVSAEKTTSLLSTLAALRFSDSVDPSDPQVTAARAHEREFRLTLFDGKSFAISLGRRPEEKRPKAASPSAVSAAKTSPPETETIAAGPVYAYIAASDEKAPINALMKKRAFQIDDYIFTGLPQKAGDLFEPAKASK